MKTDVIETAFTSCLCLTELFFSRLITEATAPLIVKVTFKEHVFYNLHQYNIYRTIRNLHSPDRSFFSYLFVFNFKPHILQTILQTQGQLT